MSEIERTGPMELGPEMTDGPTQIPRRAGTLLKLLMDDWQKLYDAMWELEKPLSDSDRRLVISRQVDLFGVVYLLGVLRELHPAHADRAAAALADQWDCGETLGEAIYQWREELDTGKPLRPLFAEDTPTP